MSSVHRLTCPAVLVALSIAASANAQEPSSNPLASLPWQEGPTTGTLGDVASIVVPEGYQFVDRAGASKFLELTQNPSDGSELGVVLSKDGSWFVIFRFSDDGYVKDDDRKLDADAILSSIRTGTERSNEIRKKRGWGTIEVVGWQQKPFYDSRTNNLTWSIQGRSGDENSINHSTRLLGRRGVMSVNLVLGPEDVHTAVPAFNTLLTGVSFNPGHRYAEFRAGDKIAEYGLAGLIVGGTGAALLKTGLLKKIWKLLVLGFIAVAGAVKKFVAGLFGRRETADAASNV
jgi:uncharacterized membrane-anchored protein